MGLFASWATNFLWALLQHWLTLLEGSCMTVALALLDKFGKGKVALLKSWISSHYGVVLLAFMLFGCFQAWLDQYTSAEGRSAECSRLQGQLTEKRELSQSLERELSAARGELSVLRAAQNPSHAPLAAKPTMDPDSFYQAGRIVATVSGAVQDFPRSQIAFQAIRPNAYLDGAREVEYRDWVLDCKDGGRELPSAKLPPGTMSGMTIVPAAIGWVCSIVRKR